MNLHPALISALSAQRETEIRQRMPPRRERRRRTTRPAQHGR